MHKIIPAAVAAVALFAASTASAASMLFEFDNTNSNIGVSSCSGAGCPVQASLMTPFDNITLAQGESKTFDFAQFTIGQGTGLGSANIDTTLAFTVPSAGPATTTGNGSYLHTDAVWIIPSTTTGTLTWLDPIQHLVGADGSKFTVQFNDLVGFTFGSTVTDTITITADSVAVPEPASWALLIMGVGMIGAALRRKASFKATAA